MHLRHATPKIAFLASFSKFHFPKIAPIEPIASVLKFSVARLTQTGAAYYVSHRFSKYRCADCTARPNIFLIDVVNFLFKISPVGLIR